MGISERVNALLGVLNNSITREQEIALVNRFVSQCLKYLDIVVNQVFVSQLLLHNDSLECRQELARMDEKRSRIHDSLIAQLGAVNRLCSKYEVEPLYEGSKDRREIGNFAMELIYEYFQARN